MRRITKGWVVAAALAGSGLALPPAASGGGAGYSGPFRRVSTFNVYLNNSLTQESIAEIVTSANRGNLLIYTDSANENLGFVDITDPANPLPGGVLALRGTPTSVAAVGGYALACVNTSADFVNTSGNLEVVDLATKTIVRTIALGGQPDSICVSPDQQYAVIVIENERDEDLGNGAPPQAPAGFLVIVDLVGGPATWTTRVVDLVGIADLYPDDPEPEYVDVNELNVAVVTLQENNHIVLVDVPTGAIVDDFSAGTVDLDHVDENANSLIELIDSISAIPREPDAIVWTTDHTFATANEGDLDGGSRGFTTWDDQGNVLFDSGNTLEHETVRHGHFPEDRAENKGNEAEGADFAKFGSERFLFIGSERSNTVAVYELKGKGIGPNKSPVFRQILPAGVGPEGLHAIPGRGLLVVANENDDRAAKFRGSIMIYERSSTPNYPTIVSTLRDGTSEPIPWGALSGLVEDPKHKKMFFGVYDSVYRASRVFRIKLGQPAVIQDEIELFDSGDVLIDSLDALKALLPGTADFVPADFVNSDGTVNLDVEGVAVDAAGAFYLASEGGGNLKNGVSDPTNRPFLGPNLIVVTSPTGVIQKVIQLPFDLTKNQLRFGFEGVAVVGDFVYVCFQREWTNAKDPAGRVRIGRYDLKNDAWGFAYYPLDAVASPNGGFVGLSELTSLGNGEFAVIERGDQGNTDAAVKRIYRFSVLGVTFRDDAQVPAFDVVVKSLAIDLLLANTFAVTGGPVPEKLEGLAADRNGDAWLVNDNDGLDDNAGETQLLKLPGLFD